GGRGVAGRGAGQAVRRDPPADDAGRHRPFRRRVGDRVREQRPGGGIDERLAGGVEELIAAGHSSAAVWAIAPRQLFGWLTLARRRRRNELAEQLAVSARRALRGQAATRTMAGMR